MFVETLITYALLLGGLVYAAYLGHGVPPVNTLSEAAGRIARGDLPYELNGSDIYCADKLAMISDMETQASEWFRWYYRTRLLCFLKGMVVAAIGGYRLLCSQSMGLFKYDLSVEVAGLFFVGILALVDSRLATQFRCRSAGWESQFVARWSTSRGSTVSQPGDLG
jgi:hypothetical protein